MTVGIFHGPKANKLRERVHGIVDSLPDRWHGYLGSWHDKDKRPRRIGEVVLVSVLASAGIGVPVALDLSKPAGHELRLDDGGQGGGNAGVPAQAPPLPLPHGNSPSVLPSPTETGGDWTRVNTGGQATIDSTTLHCGGLDQRGSVGGIMSFRPHADVLAGHNVNPHDVWTVVGELGPNGQTVSVARGMGAVASIDVAHGSLVSVRVIDGDQLNPVPANDQAMLDWVHAGTLPNNVSAWCGGQFGTNY
jgi:hypothetical protein